MSNLSSITKPSPGPAWQESVSAPSDGDIEIVYVKGPLLAGLKKRKSDNKRDPPSGHEGVGPITKRPRHSTSDIGLNEESSISGPPALGNPNTDAGASARFIINQPSESDAYGVAKHPATPPSPTLTRSADPILNVLAGGLNKKIAPSPTRQTTLRFLPVSSSKPNGQSTASALAALYNPPLGVDPDIIRWREKSRGSLILKPRDRQFLNRRRETDVPKTTFLRDKGKGKANPPVSPDASDDSSDVGIPSFAGPILNSGVQSAKGAVKPVASSSASASGAASGSKHPSLVEQAVVNSARGRNDHGPLYVNDRRQFARKTATSSKPAKTHQFNRHLPTGNDNDGTGSSSSVGSSDPATDEGNSTGGGDEIATKTMSVTHQSTTRQESSRPLTSTIKGKEKATSLPRHPPSSDVIVIESSDDELFLKPTSPIGPPQLINKSPGRTFLSKVKRPREGQKRHTIGGSMDLPTALNEMYERQEGHKRKTSSSSHKQLEQDIIDLTLDDSDDVGTQTTRIQRGSKESLPSFEVKQEKVPVTQKSMKRAIEQIQPSPHPITPQIIAPPPTTDPLHIKTTGDAPGELTTLQSIPRPRSVPVASIPDVSTTPRQSQSARASPTSPSGKTVKGHPMLSTRRMILGISESDASEAAGELEAIEAIADDMITGAGEDRTNSRDEFAVPSVPASSSSASSVRASPGLIPSLQRSTRRSSASSNDHVPLTDAESPPASSPSPEPVDTTEQPSYGGFKALTWDLHKRNLNNFHFKHYSAKDIPTSLPDSINRLSAYTRQDVGIKDVFQAFILENICDDEASAPEIEIVNEIDAEPSPVFEFNYSNRMWYGEDVTMPDYSKLKGCDCIGRCDPKSQTCACAIKTRSYLEIDGCVYEKNGRLKHPRYPIFECNDLCSCDDDCRNRVVQHGRKIQLSIRKTQNKGWGVFNGPKRTPKGTFLGIYAGELLTDEQGELRGRTYNTLGKSYLFDVDFWHLKKGHDPDEWHNKYTVDAYQAGNFTRFLNHSCEPNARLFPCYINEPDIEKPLLVLFSNKDIAPNEEICFNYMGSYSEDEDGDDDNDEYENEEEPHGEKRKDAVYRPCMCGARKCKGVMWN